MEYQITAIDNTLFTGINLHIKDLYSNILGGIVGEKKENAVYIHHIWIDEAYRGQDLGTHLLTRLEEVAKEQGYQTIYVDTFDFQAPLFYEKNGYQLYEVLIVAEHKRFYYYKKILVV